MSSLTFVGMSRPANPAISRCPASWEFPSWLASVAPSLPSASRAQVPVATIAAASRAAARLLQRVSLTGKRAFVRTRAGAGSPNGGPIGRPGGRLAFARAGHRGPLDAAIDHLRRGDGPGRDLDPRRDHGAGRAR